MRTAEHRCVNLISINLHLIAVYKDIYQEL